MKTMVYVDGVNLYYGAVKNTPYKWLDLMALCRVMIPTNTVIGIKYFTAKIQARPEAPSQPTSQLTYIRALRRLSNLQMDFCHYLSQVLKLPLLRPLPNDTGFVEVVKTEKYPDMKNSACFSEEK
jgi:hypothetical protein